MIKDFLIRKMLKAKGVPAEQLDMVMELVNKNPALFQQIASEAEAKIKSGGDQMTVMMEVMKNHQAELEQLMKK